MGVHDAHETEFAAAGTAARTPEAPDIALAPATGRVLALQRTAGNRAVARLVSGAGAPQRRLSRDGPVGGAVAPVAASPLAEAQAGRFNRAAQWLASYGMAAMLNALEDFRHQRLLAQLADHVGDVPEINRTRFRAALLTVAGLSGFQQRAAEAVLSAADRDAIDDHIYQRLMAEDVDAPTELVRWDGVHFLPTKTTDRDYIEEFLDFFGFGPPPIHDPQEQSAHFNRTWTTIDTVMDLVKTQGAVHGMLLLDDELIRRTVHDAYEAGRGDAFSPHFSITYTFVPRTNHYGLDIPGTSHDQIAHQLQGTVTFQFHHDDEPGWELSAFAQLSWFADDAGERVRLQNVMGGGQLAWVVPFAEGWMQVSVFAQALTGAAYRNHTISGRITNTADATVQGAAGGQVLVYIPGTNHHAYIGVQLTGGVTSSAMPSGALHDQPNTTFDVGGGLFFTVQFP